MDVSWEPANIQKGLKNVLNVPFGQLLFCFHKMGGIFQYI